MASISGRRCGAWVILSGMLALLQACASIVSGTNQIVSVETPGCPGARCELINDKGKFYVASTPGTVTLSRSYNNLQVTCTRDGASSEPISVASTTKGMAFGNILFGGVIGAGVDAQSGAAYDYPQLISVPMRCGTAAAPPAPPVRLGLQVERLPAADGAAAPPGARVVQVVPQSPAELAGLQVGDVILQIDGRAVRDPEDLAAQVAQPPPAAGTSRSWTLRLRRGSDELERPLTLPPAKTP